MLVLKMFFGDLVMSQDRLADGVWRFWEHVASSKYYHVKRLRLGSA
jgi:hypothetical protein